MKAAIWTSAIAFAVMAGVYFSFSSFVMRSLAALPAAQGIASMQSINKVILSSGLMPLFWGTTLAALALAISGATQWATPGAPLAVLGGLLYLACNASSPSVICKSGGTTAGRHQDVVTRALVDVV